MINILITGKNSYIGNSVQEYLLNEPEKYSVKCKDTIGWEPKKNDFNGTDVVFNVAGMAHIKETAENSHLYYGINRDLVIKIARAAKEGGVRQFILLSTMSVYGLTVGHITKATPVNPINAYGKSKAEADKEIEKLVNANFKFACLRPPMVYGRGCKGNYQRLRSFALKSPIFPNYTNQRSMIYIGNLCEFVKICIDEELGGLFFPQNKEYVNTSQMVKQISEVHNKKIKLLRAFNWAVELAPFVVVKKVFGNLTYEEVDKIEKYGFWDSIRLTEGEIDEDNCTDV